MKATNIMLAFIGTILLTWLFISFLYYAGSGDITFRQAATADGIIFIMLLVGWIPSLIVSIDLDEKLV